MKGGQNNGVKAAAVKLGVRANSARANSGEVRHIDNPYTHLAASIILQAYDDLRNLKGEEVGKIEQSTVDRWEIINFFRSRWCGFLLSCQDAITQEEAENAAWAIFQKQEEQKMNNAKSIIVTAVVTAMLILIMAGMALLKFYKALGIMLAIFALIGICNFAGAFFRWLSAKGELTLDPIVTEESEPEESYEEIMEKFWSEA